MKRLEDTAGFLKALGHPARLQIVDLLRHGEACVCHLEAHLGYRQPYISQQIMVLRRAGLLSERRDGTYVFYRLTDSRVVKLLDTFLPEVGGTHRRASGREAICSCPECTPIMEARA